MAYKIRSVADLTNDLECEKYEKEHVLFRGQTDDSPLIPRLGRINGIEDLRLTETKMLDDFSREAVPYLGTAPKSAWDLLAIAQHYGMATRLGCDRRIMYQTFRRKIRLRNVFKQAY